MWWTIWISIWNFQFFHVPWLQPGTPVTIVSYMNSSHHCFALKPETHKGLKRVTLTCLFCLMLVIIHLPYLERTIFGTRRRDNGPIKLRKQRDVVLLHVPAPAWKKWPTNGGKTPESRESFQRLKQGILPKHWAGYYCLTTRAKHNIMKPTDVFSKLILQISF